MIDMRETTVLVTQDAIQNFPSDEGAINIASGWAVGAGLSLFSGTFGHREERSIHTITANVASVTVTSAHAVDLGMEVLWKTADFNGATTLCATVVAQLT